MAKTFTAQTLPAEISFTIGVGAFGRHARLEIIDESSHKVVCRVSLSMEQYGTLMSGLTMSDVPVKWFAPDRIGWVVDKPLEIVIAFENGEGFDREHTLAKEAVDAHIAQLEEDNPGCDVSARHNDAWNGHRLVKRGKRYSDYKVTFWITRPPPEDIDALADDS